MGALVVTKPEAYDEFPINQAGLNYLHSAVQAGRIREGVLVLARWRDHELTFAATKSLGEVMATLADIPPRTGRYGDYWCVRADFTPDGARVVTTIEDF